MENPPDDAAHLRSACDLPADAPAAGTLFFRCNVCGDHGCADMQHLGRETPSCLNCGSTPRIRGIVRALSLTLLGSNELLPDFPVRRELNGWGMTDPPALATRLAEKFSYANTFYHCEPRVDISASEQPLEWIGKADFIISSEVFEHIVPPVRRAFENVYRLLAPGGVFILTAPFANIEATIEHFPDLHDFEVIERDRQYVLRNITVDGRAQEWSDLRFHGGPGSTLEMRIFAKSDLIDHLQATGFSDVTVYDTPDFAHGIWWPEPWSFVISARKPA